MPVTLNRTQCHSNNSFAFAPGAVEVIDLNLNSKGITATLFPMSCLAHYFCEEIHYRKWGWCLPCEHLPGPSSIWCSGGATQSSVFLKVFRWFQGQPRLRIRASSADWVSNPAAHWITQEMIKDSVFWVPLPEVLIYLVTESSSSGGTSAAEISLRVLNHRTWTWVWGQPALCLPFYQSWGGFLSYRTFV